MKIYDAGKVIAGLIVFVALFTSPFWVNAGREIPVPKPDLPKVEKQCVREGVWMKANHMQLLDEWRHEVVRGDLRDDEYKGKFTKKSLTLTCLKCHDNKKNFCDRCHTYAGVNPFCWDCHVVPKEGV